MNAAGERAPPGQHFERRRKVGLLVVGPILLGVGWLGGAFLGVVNPNRQSTPSVLNVIPYFGPAVGELVYSGNSNFFSVGLAVVLTGLQIAGTILTIFGIPSRESLVDDEYPYGREPPPPGQRQDSKLPPIQWSVAPGAPGTPLGVSLTVRN